MKKIIFFSKNLDIGGMEKALVSLLNSLVEKYNVTLVLEEKKGVLLSSLDSRIVVKEYHLSNIKLVPLRKIINFFHRGFWTLKYRNKYDFSCNYATYSIIGSRLAQIASCNSALYVHSNYYDVYEGNKGKIDEFFNPHHLDKFKSIIFVSNESRNKLSSIYPTIQKKGLVINNLIDYKNILVNAEEKIDFDLHEENINLLFIGRLDNSSKNFELLIESVSFAHNNNELLHLYIMGDGPYLEQIKLLIDKYKAGDYITLLGEKLNPYPYLKKCDYVILTSRYEGFPVIYLESLVLNKGVLTTIPVSDSNLDVRNYFKILLPDSDDIAKELQNLKKEDIKYNIDYNQINKNNIDELEKVIEGSDSNV